MITIGSIYYLIPRLFGREQMWSIRLIETHFWIATLGVVLYIASMWIAGVTEGLMWRAVNPDGTLTYAFIDAVKATHPYYVIRFLGGLMFLSGMVLMLYNVIRTASAGRPVDAAIPAVHAHA